MILGVNGIRLLGQRSGVARCIEALLRCFDEVEHPFSEVRVYTPVALPADVALPAVGRNVVVASALPSGLWEQIALPRAHGKRDLLLCPSYISPWAARCPTLLIHHGSYEGYPEAFAWWPRTRARLVYALSAHRATQVTTVSEHSRRDIARFYRLSPQKISVIPDGVDTELFFPSEDAGVAAWRRRVLGEDAPFLLYVGKPTRRRNLPQLLEAFSQLKRGDYPGYKLVLVGVDLQSSGLAQTAARLGVSPDVIGLPYLPHEEVALAYNAAALFVYPSSYEGFGMPVLEAMACGTPVVASRVGGLSVAVRDSETGYLIPWRCPEPFAERLEVLLGNDDLRRRFGETAREEVARFRWSNVADAVLGLYGEVIEGASRTTTAVYRN